MEALLREHGPFLRRLARALVGDRHVAEDLVSETWTAALQRPPGPLRDPRGWLASVLRRRAISHRRRVVARVESEPDRALAPEHLEAEQVALRLERERLLHEAVARLAEPYRTVVYLRYREELAPSAIAARTDTPLKTVKTRLIRGLALLREDLERRCADADSTRPGATWLSALAPLLTAPPSTTGAPTLATTLHWTHLLLMKKTLVLGALALIGLLIITRLMSSPRGPAPPAEGLAPSSLEVGEFIAQTPPGALFEGPDAVRLDATTSTSPTTDTPAPPRDAEVEVRILGRSGEPLAHRKVLLEGPRRAGRRDDLRSVDTDTTGTARFSGLHAGKYFAVDGRGGAREVFELVSGERRAIEWRIADPLRVRGVVVHADGSTAGGAELWCRAFVAHKYTPYLWRIGVADSLGRFELEASPHVHVQASLPTFVPSELFELGALPEVEPGVREARFELGAAGALLSGRVVDTEGRPIEGAHVVAGPRGGWFSGEMRGLAPEPPVVVTGADGLFTYPVALPQGRHEVAAHADGCASTTIEVDAHGAPLEVALQLTAGSRVIGRVKFPDGTPAVAALVESVAPDADSLRRGLAPTVSASTDEEGRFQLELVPRGTLRLRVESAYTEPLARAERTLAIDQDMLAFDVILDTEPAIAGRVVDRDGHAVQGVRIRLEAGDMTSYPRAIVTDAQGSFRATALPPTRAGVFRRARGARPQSRSDWTVEVLSVTSSTQRVHATVEDVAPGTEGLVITIDLPEVASAFLVGQLVAASTRVPADISVTLWPDGVNAGHFVEFDATTGAFRHGPLYPGTYRLDVTRQGERVASRSDIVLAAGETIDVGPIALGTGGRLEVAVTLVDAASLPIGVANRMLDDARVTLQRDGQSTQWLERTEAGWRSRELLEPGPWRLSGAGEALFLRDMELEVREGETVTVEWAARLARALDLRVELPAAATWSRVRARITEPGGAPIVETPFVERSTLQPDTFASIEVVVPPGAVRVVIETDTTVGLQRDLVVPDLTTAFRKVELRVE